MIELSQRRIPAPPWTAVHASVDPPRSPEALVDARPIIRHLRIALGDVRAAQLLGLDPLIWNAHRGGDPVDPDTAFRALELYDVLARALRIFDAATAMQWLGEPEPYLGGRLPIDILAAHGAAPVIVVLETLHSERRWFASRAC